MSQTNSSMYLPTLNEVIDRQPLTVDPDTLLVEVITLMSQNRDHCLLIDAFEEEELTSSFDFESESTEKFRNFSYVLVLNSSQVEGIFTERDLVQLIASDQDFSNLKIKEVMKQPVISLKESEIQDIFTIFFLFRQYHIRHIPVTKTNGELVGIITPNTIRNSLLKPTKILRLRTVGEGMTTSVIHTEKHSKILDVAQIMVTHKISSVVIVEKNQENSNDLIPLGIITERDIVQFKSLELNLAEITAEIVMSYPLVCVKPTDSLWQANQIMKSRYLRRLVVLNDEGFVTGIITQTNLLRVLEPVEMSSLINLLHNMVEEQTKELKNVIETLKITNEQLQNEIATRHRTESQLKLLESCVVSANDAIVIMEGIQEENESLDPSDPPIIYVNEAFTRMSGYTPEEIIGKTPSYLRGNQSTPTQVAKVRTAYLLQQPLCIELINYHKDGTPYWVELNTVPIKDEAKNLTHWVSIQRNITERKRMEQALFEEKELAQVTLNSIGDGVITTDAKGLIVSLNRVAETLTGWDREEAKGLPLNRVLKIIHEVTGNPRENTAEIALRENRIVEVTEYSVLMARNGYQFAIDHSAAPIHTNDGCIIGAVVIFRDVTQIRTQAHQLSWQATHDALTSLVNRREFEYQLQQAVQNAQKHNQQHLLLYLDLDRFKIVNDTCGHIAGDELLRQISELFKQRIRKTDMLARLGGDEFAILLYQCPCSQGIQVAESLLHSIQSFRFIWENKTFTIGVSIGLVTIDTNSLSPSNILTAADAACYAAKDKGRNRIQVYEVGDRELARQRGEAHWAVKVNQALEDNNFCLYAQPIISLIMPTNTEHYEILLRLKGEQNQLIPPMAFMPAAERYNLMHIIDRWVIRTLFASLKPTNNKNYAINLSGASINDDQFIDFLTEQFCTYQVAPELICFEITETMAIANLSKAANLIRKLKELGCQFALDDFGCGMSSFAYLKNLPVDFVKIDGNFVKNIVNSSVDLAMVEAINSIGHVMGIQTIAEYVENEMILNKLKELGVDGAQGYYIGKPQPLQTLLDSSSDSSYKQESESDSQVSLNVSKKKAS